MQNVISILLILVLLSVYLPAFFAHVKNAISLLKERREKQKAIQKSREKKRQDIDKASSFRTSPEPLTEEQACLASGLTGNNASHTIFRGGKFIVRGSSEKIDHSK